MTCILPFSPFPLTLNSLHYLSFSSPHEYTYTHEHIHVYTHAHGYTYTQSTLEEYETMPISSFGEAVLKGMGWKKGEAIGRTNKG